jgi:hypothetical protein
MYVISIARNNFIPTFKENIIFENKILQIIMKKTKITYFLNILKCFFIGIFIIIEIIKLKINNISKNTKLSIENSRQLYIKKSISIKVLTIFFNSF